MLLDIGSVFAGIGLAVIGFVIVIVVCVVILRLLAAILPSYEDRGGRAAGETPEEPDAGAVDADGERTHATDTASGEETAPKAPDEGQASA